MRRYLTGILVGAVVITILGSVWLKLPAKKKIMVLAVVTAPAAAHTLLYPQQEVRVSNRARIIQYATFKARPVQLVYEAAKARILLRIKVKGSEQLLCAGDEHDFLLKFLRDEVTKLTSGQPVMLGDTGYSFVYEGGYPIWGPHGDGAVDEYQYLLFAQNAKVVGKEIRASGTKTIEGWDGYKLWKPAPYKEAFTITRPEP